MAPIRLLSPGPDPASSAVGSKLPHVLLVLDGFPRALGGGERIALRLAGLLPRYGYRVSILTFFVDPKSPILDMEAPCPIYLLPIGRTYDLTALRAAFALRRFLREQQIRIVQTFFESSDLWAGTVARFLSSAKVIWSRRDMGILRGGKHRLAYRLLRRIPHRVFAVSEMVRRHVIEVDGVAACRVQTIYNGLELDRAETVDPCAADQPFHYPVIITIGNIRRVKGHDLLARAAVPVLQRFPEATFTIAGEVLEPEFLTELNQMIADLGITASFRLIGGITDLPAHLEAADVFVLPSRSEGFSNAIIEAMACFLPVVATDVGGNAEAVLTGTTGIVVPPDDAESLAAALIQLLASPSTAQRMGVAGKARAASEFSVDAMMRKTVAAYNGLLRT